MARPPKSIVFNSTDHAPSGSRVKQESQSTPQLHQSLQLLSRVKGEPQELSLVALPQPNLPQIFLSIEQLTNLSASINEFHRRYNELQNHLDFIQTAIDGHAKGHQQQDQPIPLEVRGPAPVPPPTTFVVAEQNAKETDSRRPERARAVVSEKSELVSLCQVMCGKGLRKYLTSHLSDVNKLRAEVPCALKCAPKPARLVLDCMGRFYLQGSRAYTKDSPMIPGRKAGVLVLEFFMSILDKDIEFDASVKQEAERAAIAWRKRLIAEGGVRKTSEIDARGLLLLLGCYGIPRVFCNEDVCDLIRLSSPKQIVDLLRRSHVLVARVSDILERMMNNGAKIEAVDIAYIFGIENKFPPQKLLASFLRDSNEALKRKKREASNSPIILKEASEKQLAALKSVIKLLEDHKLDPTNILPGWQLKEMIEKLDKEITELNKKIAEKVTQKRKADENEFANFLKSQETKRSRFTGSPMMSSPTIRLHEQRAVVHMDSNGLYSAPLRINSLDAGFSGHVSNPPVTGIIQYGSSGQSLTEHAIGMGTGYSVRSLTEHASGMVTGGYSMASTSPYSGVQREMLVDGSGQIMSRNGPSYGLHGVGGSAFVDESLVQAYARQPAPGLFSSSIEGFAGLPNSSPTAGTNRSSTSDLYRFADAVK